MSFTSCVRLVLAIMLLAFCVMAARQGTTVVAVARAATDIMNPTNSGGASWNEVSTQGTDQIPAPSRRGMIKPTPVPADHLTLGLIGLCVAACVAWVVTGLIIRSEKFHCRFSHDQVGCGPQKYHALATPRIGGIALAIGLLTTGLAFFWIAPDLPLAGFWLLTCAAVPAFAGGLIEDFTKRVGVQERLILTMMSAAIGIWVLDAVLTTMEIPLLGQALKWMPFAMAFTIFAVGGVVNAINIIDGYNGLASGYAIITLAAIAWVATQVGDSFILFSSLTMLGCVMGFFFWNWPRGKIFLGDGGAYLLGFWLAELCVLLVVRNPDFVYARLCLALMIYPVFETVFTIYRRRFLQKQSPGQADNMHLHQLIYKNLTRSLSQRTIRPN
jgi:UDP-GlcNAc:undecaprenyl-phosphate/decaprenyl-phosphate GlcNAc-1-phosphate transferase